MSEHKNCDDACAHKFGSVCSHGSLERSCIVCDLQAENEAQRKVASELLLEIEELKKKLGQLKNYLDAYGNIPKEFDEVFKKEFWNLLT